MGQQMDKEAELLICSTKKKNKKRTKKNTSLATSRDERMRREGDRKRNTDTGMYSKEVEEWNKRG